MLRAHYRETPKLQAARSKKGKDNGSKAWKNEEKERKKEEANEVAQVYREPHVARTFPESMEWIFRTFSLSFIPTKSNHPERFS